MMPQNKTKAPSMSVVALALIALLAACTDQAPRPQVPTTNTNPTTQGVPVGQVGQNGSPSTIIQGPTQAGTNGTVAPGTTVVPTVPIGTTTPPPAPGILPGPGPGGVVVTGSNLRLGEVNLAIPAGWSLAQDGAAGQTSLVGLIPGNEANYVNVYATSDASATIEKIFTSGGATVTKPKQTIKVGEISVDVIETTKTPNSSVASKLPVKGAAFVSGFFFKRGAMTYFGYARASDAATASTLATQILSTIK